ncbi:MAG: TIM barrel protein [Verrucomicrobia bacterium]|nr:TIM barrel protein [Cytophagales bacterium]
MLSRRNTLKKISQAMVLGSFTAAFSFRFAKAETNLQNLAGKINHSACRWCYGDIPFETLVKAGKKIGLQSIELTGPSEWEILKKYDMTSAMGWAEGGNWGNGLGLENGFNKLENHENLVKVYEDLIPKAAKAGIKSVICFSGNRKGLDAETGLKNCKEGLQKIIKTAEKYKINVVMELLNSKIDHKDYQCDHTAWGVELCKMVGSERFQLLYDIYHMQIMEGDVIRNIKENYKYIAHYHTGGVPGRHEIDESQELYYPAIMKAIVETGYKGFVGQEFIPTPKDQAGKIASLTKAVKICDI